MQYKNFDHTLERLELFLDGKCYPKEQEISIQTQFYPRLSPLKGLRVIRDTGRVKPNSMGVRPDSDWQEEAKLGDVFGPSWATHWFLVEIEVPKDWPQDSEIHFLWNGKCEGSLYNRDGSRLLQAFSENVRTRYIIRRAPIKNDLSEAGTV